MPLAPPTMSMLLRDWIQSMDKRAQDNLKKAAVAGNNGLWLTLNKLYIRHPPAPTLSRYICGSESTDIFPFHSLPTAQLRYDSTWDLPEYIAVLWGV
jgi:hypothetical protein